LADAVRSVFAQTFADWELILLDDGSTDGSAEFVSGINDQRVRLVSDGVNRGLVTRLNQIAALARGKYLARMDADDLMHPERIERQLAFLHANADIDLVDTATYTIDNDLTPLGIRGECPLDVGPETVISRGLLIHPTVMGRAEWFRNNPYSAAFVRAEDRELWTRTCTTAKFGRLCEPLFFYREDLTGNLRNYLLSEATLRKILRLYGPPLVGSRRTHLLVLRSRLKSLAYFLATKVGVQGRLISGRNRPLDAAAAQAGRGILVDIARTSVPGLCGGAPREEPIG
jgi:glycosyltransferase involved in cell wall biosynthesis